MYLNIVTWNGKGGDLIESCQPRIILSDVYKVKYYDEEDKKVIEVMFKDGKYSYYTLTNNAFLMNEEGKVISSFGTFNCYGG